MQEKYSASKVPGDHLSFDTGFSATRSMTGNRKILSSRTVLGSVEHIRRRSEVQNGGGQAEMPPGIEMSSSVSAGGGAQISYIILYGSRICVLMAFAANSCHFCLFGHGGGGQAGILRPCP